MPDSQTAQVSIRNGSFEATPTVRQQRVRKIRRSTRSSLRKLIRTAPQITLMRSAKRAFADNRLLSPGPVLRAHFPLRGNRYGDSDLIANRRVDVDLAIRGSYGNDERVANALIVPLVAGILFPPAPNRIDADG